MEGSQVHELRRWRDQAFEQHQFSTAELLADKILAFTKNPLDAYWLAQVHYQRGNYLRAAHLIESRGDHLRSLRSKYMAGLCLLAAQQFDRGIELLAAPSEGTPEPGAPGAPGAGAGAPAGASPGAGSSAGASTESLLAYLEGQLYACKNNFEKAKTAFQNAVSLDPRCYDAYAQLVEHSLLSPAEERTLIDSLDFSALGANADLIKDLYTLRLSKISEIDGVTEAVARLGEEYDLSDNVDLLNVQASILLTQCRFKECKALCERILGLDPYNYEVHNYYLSCLHDMAEKNRLFKVAHDLAAQAPQEPVAWVAVALYYLSIGNVTEARRFFSKASIMNPYCLQAWLGFAHTFAQEGEHEQAVTAFSAAARLFPGLHQPYLFLGMQHLHLNNIQLAEEYLATAHSICSVDPLLLNEQAVVCYHKDDLERARELFELSLALSDRLNSDPETWTCIKGNLGYVHRRLGNYEQSLAYFEEVVRTSTPDHNILTAMGLVHLQMEQYDQAIARLNDSLSLSRDSSVTSELMKRAMDGFNRQFSLGDIVAAAAQESQPVSVYDLAA